MERAPILDEGELSFSIESRILRELGERLVKQPEVALVELIKNAYDADATECQVTYDAPNSITVKDDGSGMSLRQFTDGWMRIGTSAKEATRFSNKYYRLITGEKGIGRFAVRFLGRILKLETIANDSERQCRTRLTADFDWPRFDLHEDLGKVQVPYRLEAVVDSIQTGTTLVISRLRTGADRLDLRRVRTSSMGVLSPLRSMLREIHTEDNNEQPDGSVRPDPGLSLQIHHDGEDKDGDVAAGILSVFTLRAVLRMHSNELDLRVYRRGSSKPHLKIIDSYPNSLAKLYADIRFFPRRKGAFADLPLDGRHAYGWIAENSGVAVFDRSFRVSPYGMTSDDWLSLAADAARNRRDPRSKTAQKHLSMSAQERAAPSENWMLRLPQSAQLVGLVQVEGRRTSDVDANVEDEGLVAAADREGFVENRAFGQLQDLVRGAVEAIAYVDRRLQQEEEQARREALLASIQQETQSAIDEIESNPNISPRDKTRIVAAIAQTAQLAEKQQELTRERERQLEVMSLLGVVAGFMTHEFGVALQELESTHAELEVLAKAQPRFEQAVQSFALHIANLKEFVTYSAGYIQGAKTTPEKLYPVKPRLRQVKRVFGRYAEERNIDVEITAETDLVAPPVPVSLYNGIALNLYTNALKAVTSEIGTERGTIAFRAWNDNRWHYLEVSDTGVGIPSALHDRVFDPLFTTTSSRKDPLGSGMGLGLTLVRRGAEAFEGHAEIVEPPPGFTTCVRVRLPLKDRLR